jgi:hypothetical protein
VAFGDERSDEGIAHDVRLKRPAVCGDRGWT